MKNGRQTTLLLILDGWGHSDRAEHNAIRAARAPVWNRLWAEHPHTLISGSGEAVGLPAGQMGNSEVGHMTIGAGRVLHQTLTRINAALAGGEFETNPAYLSAIDRALARGGAVHLLGLLSPGGVHSHEDHILAAVALAARRGARVYLHAFLDGRDTPPRSAEASLRRAQTLFAELGCGRIASICGRYYAMDRDQRWERTRRAYELLTQGEAPYREAEPVAALRAAYARNEGDEFVQPTLIQAPGEPAAAIADGDAVIFMNFRPDRARQLTRAFVDADFSGFSRKRTPRLADFVTTTEYAADLPASCAFPPLPVTNSLGEYLAGLGKTQLRIAETEKYAHVTFFFSGGRETPYPGEERILVPSPQVATYDLQPEMSVHEVTRHIVDAIGSRRFDLIVCNFANGDMVGHTGVFEAAVRAVEAVDACLGQLLAALAETGGQCLITADHGNLECMAEADGGPSTSHTRLPVPLVYAGPLQPAFGDGGTLADVAPTVLTLMDLPQPPEMTGHSLIESLETGPGRLRAAK
ncbi:MAG: phosphoglycerate mutase (2,3-diphosphoglycerate-independent) [Porticoccaceae bacterium]|nr:phosphoglycerate mutase (2,3-diphosphoglycerate-independent) [Porticoccaceae bacterium]